MRAWRSTVLALLLMSVAACDGSKKDAPATSPAQTPPAAPTPGAPAAPTAELVSLSWTPRDGNQNLQAFDLEITGLDLLAVCHVPPGWTINATGAGSGVTDLKGQATVGAAFVSLDDLEDIAGLFLVRARPGEAVSVSGRLTTGSYTGEEGQMTLKATSTLLRREAADRCPPPKG